MSRLSLVGEQEMQCPRCNVGLESSEPGEHGFVIVDKCPSCKGTWFDKNELDRLDESVWLNAEQDIEFRVANETNSQELECPKCRTKMEPLSPKDATELVIDRCPDCLGFWLDKGELDKLRESIDETLSEEAEDRIRFAKPDDWSKLRWRIYLFKTFGGFK